MKRFAKIIVVVILLILLLAAAVILQRVDPDQKKPIDAPYTFADTLSNQTYNLDSLKAIIGSNKGLPPGFEVAGAIAYSAYPQLKNVSIDMVLTQEGAPMESTPVISSLFGPRKNRHYLILLNDARASVFDPILLRSLPFDAQIGILAHELGHVAYYEELNVFAFGKWGLQYLISDEFRAAHERTTDLMPIYHGLGSQIYQYAYFVRKDPSCKAFYEHGKAFMDKYYLTDIELRTAIDQFEMH